ncbi:hypothetical protein K2X33_03960, partial [bacterium]|nr:hypothetical protein [bacterium]
RREDLEQRLGLSNANQGGQNVNGPGSLSPAQQALAGAAGNIPSYNGKGGSVGTPPQVSQYQAPPQAAYSPVPQGDQIQDTAQYSYPGISSDEAQQYATRQQELETAYAQQSQMAEAALAAIQQNQLNLQRALPANPNALAVTRYTVPGGNFAQRTQQTTTGRGAQFGPRTTPNLDSVAGRAPRDPNGAPNI